MTISRSPTAWYAEFLPEWLETFGAERLRIIDFAELIADPVPRTETA